MQYTDHHHHLRVEFQTRECQIPSDELTRMERSLTPLAEAVQDFASAELRFTITYHPRIPAYHVEARLKLPGRTLFTGSQDTYLDSAFQRCVNKIARRAEAYREHPDREAGEVAQDEAALDRDIVAPEDPGAGPLGEAVRAGSFRAFRNLLSGYEEWLRKRVGRWVQRHPEAQARGGKDLRLGDLVEEVFLNAFEHYAGRPTEVPLHEWLNGLLEPSLQLFLRHPDQERENASLARSLREMPADQT